MYFSEIQAMSDDKLIDLYEDQKETLYRYRLQKATGELVDTTVFRKTRRDVARILTVIRQRELAAEIAEEES